MNTYKRIIALLEQVGCGSAPQAPHGEDFWSGWLVDWEPGIRFR